MNALRDIVGRSFSYDDEDHLLTAGSVIYSYNLDGFLAAKTDGSDVTTYDYSSRGELLSVMLLDGRIIEYVHDPLGRRIAKKIDGVVVEKYLWKGLAQLLAVYGGSDNLLMRFEYTDGRMPMTMTKSGSTYYLTYDQVGSLRVVADASGTVVKRIDYDSFGNIIGDTDPSFEVPFGFAGGLYDPDAGLVRFGYRDYDPDTGRWTAKDPILFASGDTDLYGYCLRDPIYWVDQYGLQGMNDFARQWGIGGSVTEATGNVWSQTARQASSSQNAAESYRERSIKHEKTGDRAHFYAEFFGSAPYDPTGGYIPFVLVPAEAALANYYYGLSEHEWALYEIYSELAEAYFEMLEQFHYTSSPCQ